ncbi:T9SS type A sorting domain-containing protein [Flavobacterium sp. CYK-55]|uniref:T9SS type A sorting domain-containing protein n=1 Tax=Flavobacterium sp. CYK-55 TaxID=2835529 RepID=UPI001BCB230E|nr:T9SS type A sorting domain-containing protein [Flavobacterium sp. CYK-55]MBS7785922.1 T9SS type A sorting domain-containing protein [Flavobacterium sp. CYK-55]
MRKLNFFLMMIPLAALAQTKGTNPISVQNLNAGLVLNNNTQTVTLTMVGPSDRWMAIQYGQFSGGMEEGSDVAYFNGTTLVDARHNGIGTTPSADAENNWTVTQNTVSSGFRTLVATRPFNSPDATDYDFNYDDTTIGIAIARGNTASFNLAYHGAANKTVNTALGFTNLGVSVNEKQMIEIFPNPCQGFFTVKSAAELTEVSVYNLSGSKITSVKPSNSTQEIQVSDLSVGVYLVELKSDNQTEWKKIIVE